MKIMIMSCKDYNFYNFRSKMILGLKEMGHEVVLNCPYGKKIDYFTQRGCRFIDVEMDRRGRNIFRDAKLIMDYNRILKAEKPDLALIFAGKTPIYGGFVCGVRGIPCIINNAGLAETTGLFDLFLKLLYWLGFRKASCMMYQNTYERDVLNRLLKNKVHYRDIPGSGVDLEEFTYQPYPGDEAITFNYVGRVVKFKGIDEFLSCAKRIRERHANTRFVIYGDYDDDAYRAQIAEYERQGIIEYGGVQLDMKPCIKAAHAVIHGSYYEGMTNVVLEHSAMGRVCIGSDIPGVREGIDDGVTGFVFKVKDAGSMTQAVEKFLSLTHEQKEEMGKRARAKMEREFDRQIVTDIYYEEITRIQKDRGL